MKQVWNKLNIGFLWRFDRYLLANYPALWRTRGHWFIFWGLGLAILLFMLGFMNIDSVSLNDLYIPLIQPILIWKETDYLLPLVLVLIAMIYWIYCIHQNALGNDNWKKTTITIGIYGIGMLILVGITTSAYRMGKTYFTAYHLMEQEHIDHLEENNMFAYGYRLLPTDTIDGYFPQIKEEFEIREIEFNKYREKEESLLRQERYDTLLTLCLRSDGSDFFLLSERSNLSSFFPLVDLLTQSDISDMSFMVERSYRSYMWRSFGWNMTSEPGMSFLAYLSRKSNLSEDLSNRTYRLYQLYRVVLSGRDYELSRSNGSYTGPLSSHLDLLDQTELRNLSNLTEKYGYSNYYRMTRLTNFKESLVNDYNLNDSDSGNYLYFEQDTLYVGGDTTYNDSVPIYSPFHIYQLENGVRSVHHARQYWENGIIFRYHKSLLWILFPFIFLMIGIPYLSLRQIMLAFFVMVGWYFLQEFYFLQWFTKVKRNYEGEIIEGMKSWGFLFFNPFILLAFIGFLFSFFIKRKNNWTDFSFHLLLVSLLGTIAYLIYYSILDFLFLGWNEIEIYVLVGGLSFLSLVGCYLTPYYHSLPRSS